MSRIRWTEPADADLGEIWSFIAQDSRQNANRFVRRIRESVKQLARFPESGSLVPELEDLKFREIFVSSYRIIYNFDGREIQINAVTHGARRLPSRLNEL